MALAAARASASARSRGAELARTLNQRLLPQPVRAHQAAPASASSHAPNAPNAPNAATSQDSPVRESPEAKVRKEAQGKEGRALYAPEMPREAAAAYLGRFVGVPDLRPGEVVCLDADQIHGVLSAAPSDARLDQALFSHANGVTERFFQNEVYYRGIVEFSNVCQSDCGYCGIRKHQQGIHRYTMPKEDVVNAALWAYGHNYGSLMLQAGELNTPSRMQYLKEVVREIRSRTVALEEARLAAGQAEAEGRAAAGGEAQRDQAGGRGQEGAKDGDTPVAVAGHEKEALGTASMPQGPAGVVEPWQRRQKGLCVALSVGEMERGAYQELFDAGATRYLLRIETSNPALFATLHPAKQSFEHRLQCLRDLRMVGFQLGTGVMIGLPGQTLMDLANDVVFFRKEGANMIGMGPYITEDDTPVAKMWAEAFPEAVRDKAAHMAAMFELTTRMVALVRITLGNANVTATTALQAINPVGREIALRRGANVLMPILTPTQYREDYQLYEGKPCITDTADECRRCLGVRVNLVGKRVNPGIWADPPNFIHPVVTPATPFGARALHSGARGAKCRGAHTGCADGAEQRQGGGAEGPVASSSLGSSQAKVVPSAFLRENSARTGTQHSATGRGSGRLQRWGARLASTRSGGAEQGKGGGAAAPFDIPRVNVGLFGAMNAGKSTLINCITMQETSIVDSKPGTTADTKIATMELHGVGPVKLFDTAGIDEEGELGAKKRAKALGVLKECDVALLLVNPLRGHRTAEADLEWEKGLVETAQKRGKDLVLIFNIRARDAEAQGLDAAALERRMGEVARSLDASEALPWLGLDLSSRGARERVTGFVEERIRARQGRVLPSIPPRYLARDAMIFLNIPMDAETPGGRLLRPQAMVQEEALRAFGTTLAYRMDLAAARGSDPGAREAERARFRDALGSLLAHRGPKLMVTDSQAMDIVHPWTLDDATGAPLVDLTTFSIAMIQRQTDGQLPVMVEGLRAFTGLKAGDRVLVAEACNHNRITELCNDIATVQIPQKLAVQNPQGGVHLDHAFGREFPDLAATPAGGLGQYALAIHCGGCMVDRQKILARIEDLKEAGVPVTNFGLLLSYAVAPDALWRVVAPYGLAK